MNNNILLIEKDELNRANWHELLSLFKYKTKTIGNVDNIKSIDDLLTKYFTEIHLVIADTDVVGLDAIKLKALMNNDLTRVPLILVSADNVPEWTLEREESGAVAFLRKPFENAILLEYVSKALKLKQFFSENLDTGKIIAKLLVDQPPDIPTEYLLRRSYTVGRYRNNDEFHADIRLKSPNASRKHAFLIRIYKGRDSYYKLIDFSTNGIQINGRRMPKMIRLNHQDEIVFYPGCKAVFTEVSREDNDFDVTLSSNG